MWIQSWWIYSYRQWKLTCQGICTTRTAQSRQKNPQKNERTFANVPAGETQHCLACASPERALENRRDRNLRGTQPGLPRPNSHTHTWTPCGGVAVSLAFPNCASGVPRLASRMRAVGWRGTVSAAVTPDWHRPLFFFCGWTWHKNHCC